MATNEEMRSILILEAQDKSLTKVLRSGSLATRKFSRDIANLGPVVEATFTEVKKGGVASKKAGNEMSDGSKKARRFSMELLGVGFFGNMVGGALLGLLKPASDLFGIFDLLNITLGVFFLPLLEQIFPFLLSIMEWFMNMPDGVKLLVGWIVLLGGAFFIVLGTLSFLALGLESLGILIARIMGLRIFAIIAGWFTAIKTFITTWAVANAGILTTIGIIGAWILSAAAVVGVLFLLKEKFGSFGNALKAWAKGIMLAIALVVQGVVDIILAPITIIIAAIKLALDLYNRAARSELGKKLHMKEIDTSGLKDFMVTMNTGIVTGTAELLDKWGFNPQPVAQNAGTKEILTGGSSFSGADATQAGTIDALRSQGYNNADIVNMLSGSKTGGATGTASGFSIVNNYNTQVQDTAELRKLYDEMVREQERTLAKYATDGKSTGA